MHKSLLHTTASVLKNRFSLIEDKAEDRLIDESLRSGIVLRGTNLWVLMFAIFIASIGLNVNSTAVIIGAMLISPLMGPIMGIGYGIGIYDALLIKNAFRNLGIATVISLLVSTLYFLVTPLSDAQSELLARTTPTIWDVMIAFFGGLAGMIGATRSEKTNIIPGVAIATALMPPLCTAGYGLANAQWQFFFGAFYLYSINCVFIAFAAILIIWVLNPSHKQFIDKTTEARVRRVLTTVVLLTMLPSIYLAVKLVNQEVFNSKAKAFINKEMSFDQAHLTERNIDPIKKRIEVTFIGAQVSPSKLKETEAKLNDYGLVGASLVVHQSSDQPIDMTALKSNIVSELYQENLYELDRKNKIIQQLQTELANTSTNKTEWQNMAAELHAQYPQIKEVLLSEALQWQANSPRQGDKLILLNVTSSRKLSLNEKNRITAWLKVRAKSERVKLLVN